MLFDEIIKGELEEADDEADTEDVGKTFEEFDLTVPISKTVDDERLAFGFASVVMKNGEVVEDRQGDYIESLADMENASYDFVMNSRDGGVEHVRKGVAQMVESVAITPEKLTAWGLAADAVDPSWWVGYKVNDEEVWKDIKSGKLPMFSVHGRGIREEIEDGS